MDNEAFGIQSHHSGLHYEELSLSSSPKRPPPPPSEDSDSSSGAASAAAAAPPPPPPPEGPAAAAKASGFSSTIFTCFKFSHSYSAGNASARDTTSLYAPIHECGTDARVG